MVNPTLDRVRARAEPSTRKTSYGKGKRGQRGRRNARRNAIGFACLALVAFGVVVVAVRSTSPAGPLADAPTIETLGPEVSITWLGDTLLGDEAQPYLDRLGYGWSFTLLDEFDGDVVIANAEAPITARTVPSDPSQRWSYNADPASAAALAEAGIDAISLANNHTFDRGADGLRDTIAHANAAGIEVFGGGESRAEARLPLVVESRHQRVAVAAFSDAGVSNAASSQRPGMRRLSLDNLRADLDRARRGGADRVVAFVHWGENYQPVDDRQEEWARQFAVAGYDLVVGTGPHIAQPIVRVDGMPVIYSLGNFAFGTPGRFSGRAPGEGLVVTTTLWPDGRLEITARCLLIDNDLVQFRPRPCTRSQSHALFVRITRSMLVSDGVASMELTLDN